MEVVQSYKWSVYDTADTRTRDWPFLGDFMPVLCIILTYLYIIKIKGPQFMEKREPYNLKRIIQIYNIIQIVSCGLIMKEIANNISFSDIISTALPDRSNNYHAVQQTKICWWIMCLKMFELIETVFFILRKKYNQASLLHLHHHVVTLLMSWTLANYYPGGGALFPAQINTFIHFIMYTYYFLSTLGPKWQKALGKWKNKLTIMQMVQFCIILLHACQIFLTTQWRELPLGIHLLFFPNIIFIFKNFYDFYQDNYTKPKLKNN